MKKLALSFLILSGATAFARDAKDFHNLGFSDNGQYYAFLESVDQDGTGFPEAEGSVIDVAANKLVLRKGVVVEQDKATVPMAIRQVLSKLRLSRYGITQKNLGRTLWERAQTDVGAPVTTAEFVGERGNLWPRFTLNLSMIPLEEKDECFGFPRSMIVLSLSRKENGAVQSVELQRDTRLPKSRDCSREYELRQVIQHKNAIAVVLRYLSPGFEGPDENALVVTAKNVLK
jgi:predicted secreted protein